MLLRPPTAVLVASSLLTIPVGTAQTPTPARLIVENETYSSLQITLVAEDGHETRLGQAPPDFANTLLIAEPIPDGEVHFAARLVGENRVLYRSDPVRLVPGRRIRWVLPANVLEL